MAAMITDRQYRFLATCRVGHLATAGRDAAPHVVPVCFAVEGSALYVTIDEKPKRAGRRLRRIANILENPAACFVADHYDENWTRLAWVMLQGNAEILADGDEHDAAQALLRRRYPQLAAMDISDLPVIALRVARAIDWGEIGMAMDSPD
ncbi:MAG TPA: TIGR03668 family PPOX class F420-dependent oxidoreductase [Acetobacteraceae bacterium]|nr:TIGR03668 family PPOX class F420-dependent oxidoreductase [Acetobacteraceae bacterium]